MLKSRVFTAVILLLLFLAALFGLPDGAWAILVTVVVLQGASEWSRLAKFSHKTANGFWGLTLVLMLVLAWFDSSHTFEQRVLSHIFVYAASALLWMAIVPAWLLDGWKVEGPLLMALVGWEVLIPHGLAMVHFSTTNPWGLLGSMSTVWLE